MSNLTRLRSLIASLPATPLRPAGSPQLSNALESIINRATKRSGGSEAEKLFEGMSGSLERLKNGSAARTVSLSFPFRDSQAHVDTVSAIQSDAEAFTRSYVLYENKRGCASFCSRKGTELVEELFPTQGGCVEMPSLYLDRGQI